MSPQISSMEPGIEELRGSMPKAIAIPSHDWGVEGMFILPMSAQLHPDIISLVTK